MTTKLKRFTRAVGFLSLILPTFLLRNEEIVSVRKEGDVFLLCRYRELQYNIHLDIYSKMSEIKQEIKVLNDICFKLQSNKICRRIISNLEFDIEEYATKIHVISAQDMLRERPRSKRNIIDKMTRSNNLSTTIFQKTNTLVDHGYDDLRKNDETIKEQLKCLINAHNNLEDYIGHLNFNAVTQILTSTLKKISNTAEIIYNILINKNPTEITKLISIHSLIDEVSNIDSEAQKEKCNLPIQSIDTEVFDLLKISNFEIKLFGNTLNVQIQIPTVYNHTYELLKGIPIPFTFKDASYEAILPYEYFMAHEQKMQQLLYAIPLDNSEISNCRNLPNGNILCFPTRFIQYQPIEPSVRKSLFVPDFHNCSYLSDVKSLQDTSCNFVKIRHKNKMIKIESNSYYFYVVQSSRAKIVCVDRVTTFAVDESTYKEIPDDCKIDFEDIKRMERPTKHASEIRTILNNSLSFTIYPQDLLKMKILSNRNTSTEGVNLKSDFADLNKDILEHYDIFSLYIQQWKSRDQMLITVISLLIVSQLATWIIFGYHIRKLRLLLIVKKTKPLRTPPPMENMFPLGSITNRLKSISDDNSSPLFMPSPYEINYFNTFPNEDVPSTSTFKPNTPFPTLVKKKDINNHDTQTNSTTRDTSLSSSLIFE